MDPVYLIGSLVGVALLVGLNVVLLGRARTRLERDAAAARLAGDVPGFAPGASAVSADGQAALIENARDGALWLVEVKGDGLVTRNLKRDGLRGAARDGGKLTLTLADFTLPRVQLVLADADAARAWQAHLEGG